MKQIFKHIIASAVGILSCVSALAQHESQPFIQIRDEYSDFLQRQVCGRVSHSITDGSNYKGEVVIPGKYYSYYLKSFAKVNWIEASALGHAKKATSFYVPASATEFPTYLNKTKGLGKRFWYDDGSMYISDNSKTVTYESPHPIMWETDVQLAGSWLNNPQQEPPYIWSDYEQHWVTIRSPFRDFIYENCNSLRSIVVLDPNTELRSIKGVLYNGQLLEAYPPGRTDEEYIIPEPTAAINRYAFAPGCKLKSLTLPSTIEGFSSWLTFYNLTDLEKLYVNWTSPPDFLDTLFSDITYETCTLIVPDGTIYNYFGTIQWSRFNHIVEKSAAGLEIPDASSKDLTCDVYSLSGVKYKSGVSPRD